MSKRIVAVVLSVLLMVPVLPTASAAQVVNYTVTAFACGTGTGASNFTTNSLTPGAVRTVGNVASSTGVTSGFYIPIPANSQSGYLVVAGIRPVLSPSSSSGWTTPSTYYDRGGVSSYYFSSTPPTNVSVSNSGEIAQAFTGLVYIPAHTATLYLVVYAHSSSNVAGGASYASNGFINFLPETAGPDYSSILQQILSQLQGLKSEASSILDQVTSTPEENQVAQAIVDQIEQTMQEIEALNKQIEDNTNRPDPDDLLPSAPAELLPPSDDAAVAGYEAVSSILASPLMLSLLVMVFTLAFVRYVLFGKHDG